MEWGGMEGRERPKQEEGASQPRECFISPHGTFSLVSFDRVRINSVPKSLVSYSWRHGAGAKRSQRSMVQY
jgi:hypothetical protein